MTWNVYEVAADHEFRIGDKNVAYFRVLSTGRRGEDKARATLAAAAPELVNMCERLLGFAHHYADAHALLAAEGMLTSAKELIAKAKGGAA